MVLMNNQVVCFYNGTISSIYSILETLILRCINGIIVELRLEEKSIQMSVNSCFRTLAQQIIICHLFIIQSYTHHDGSTFHKMKDTKSFYLMTWSVKHHHTHFHSFVEVTCTLRNYDIPFTLTTWHSIHPCGIRHQLYYGLYDSLCREMPGNTEYIHVYIPKML